MRLGDIFVGAILLCLLLAIASVFALPFAPADIGPIVIIIPLLFLIAVFGGMVLWIWMVVDLIKRPLKDKIVWALLLVFVSGIASFLYYALVYRKNVRDAEGGGSGTSSAVLVVLIIAVLGFILIVGAIVVGVLVFIVSSPLGPSVVCSSSDPAKIMIKASNLESYGSISDSLGTIKLQNLTGGDLSNISCVGSEAFASTVPGCPITVQSGMEINLIPNAGSAKTHTFGRIKMNYNDYSNQDKTVVITCSGPITIS
ncbi:MAG: PLDc N-terminal domain-containing protein [Candidatus Diapherotrites archaeon]|uniref:PLDc N-terminal domain-containing protein n=1 Tax=Candidatus Iainarchaeum sp. TaxID=3101447 RepID=A0A939C8H2_9ARCH|nr:PLDc N-terminal domain-containing protein [Candidatus Diapherotrites archaeon]